MGQLFLTQLQGDLLETRSHLCSKQTDFPFHSEKGKIITKAWQTYSSTPPLALPPSHNGFLLSLQYGRHLMHAGASATFSHPCQFAPYLPYKGPLFSGNPTLATAFQYANNPSHVCFTFLPAPNTIRILHFSFCGRGKWCWRLNPGPCAC
jgi:hypothetical protein